jgi:fructose-bisphosphate aldolase class 1
MKRSRKLLILVGVIGILFLIFASKLFVTNDQGYYQAKQAFITGKMSVRMSPGTYGQNFGTITTYKANATVGFGSQEGDISANLDSIPVVFNEGSYAKIAGLIRVQLPNTEEGIKNLLQEFAGGYDHFIEAGIVPIVENAVKLGANLRSAQDAYTTLALFQQSVQDQLSNGVYVTHSERKTIVNATGDTEVRQVTVISLDKDSIPMRQPNRLQELGCKITSCVIDVPGFDATVVGMIAKRKEEAMKTELAKQAALRAQQDAITAEEQGKADVAKAKYVKEVELIEATTKAREKFEVAEFKAKEAAQDKIAKILAAEAVKQELLIADGLSAKAKYQIDADVKRDIGVAEHMSKWVGPQIVMAGGDGGSKGSGIENALMIKMMSEMVKSPSK